MAAITSDHHTKNIYPPVRRERLISERRNATSAYRWRERLRMRVEAGVADTAKDAAFMPYLGTPSLREETVALLSAPPQAPFSNAAAGMQIVTILMLVYTLATQVFTILWTRDTPYLKYWRAAAPPPPPLRGPACVN